MNMKHIIILTIFTIILVSFISSASFPKDKSIIRSTVEEEIVFIEYTTATWCPQCPGASETLYNLNTKDISFYYISLVVDMNPAAQQRSQEYTNYAIPSVYFDGGYIHHIGSNGVLSDIYSSSIDESSQRSNRKPVNLTGSVEINDEQNMNLIINITNTGNQQYTGRIRSYITEKESRWNDADGNPYHFALLDFALNKQIRIKKGETITLKTQWNPQDTSFEDPITNVNPNNLMIFTTVSHWIPHFRSGFIQFPYLQFYFAHYIDQVVLTIP
ncbi:MAG: glutaredoxin [Candidatus Thermoplasmatota archaeon]|nr:glutaredoxin [Candidatus Thermoplasmatota archaeon]